MSEYNLLACCCTQVCKAQALTALGGAYKDAAAPAGLGGAARRPRARGRAAGVRGHHPRQGVGERRAAHPAPAAGEEPRRCARAVRRALPLLARMHDRAGMLAYLGAGSFMPALWP